LDVTNKEGLKKSVEQIFQSFGTLSVVISNAGTNRRKSSALADINVWEDVLRINLLSAMDITRLCLPHLLRHAKHSSDRSSYLVYINSNYASSRAPTLPGTAVYNAAKNAMAGFARTVLEDVRSWGVKVSTIYPGLVNTDLGKRPNPQQKEGKGAGPGGSMLLAPEEMIQSEDVAKLVGYCCSTRSNCVATELSLDTQRNQQPLLRQHSQAFSEKFWKSALEEVSEQTAKHNGAKL